MAQTRRGKFVFIVKHIQAFRPTMRFMACICTMIELGPFHHPSCPGVLWDEASVALLRWQIITLNLRLPFAGPA
ncbi:hypothetical protein DMENIID0001_044390 [Sergentomyia squamirostris]